MTKAKYKNFPLADCDTALQQIMRELPEGSAFFQKWTCGNCGRRVTGNEPNKLFIGGQCEDCGHVTDLRKAGCNYSLHMAIGGIASVKPKGSA